MKKHIKFVDDDDKYHDDNEDDYHIPDDKHSKSQFDQDHTNKWHSQLPEEPVESKPVDVTTAESLKKEANSLLHGDSLAYSTKMEKVGSSDQKWARSLLNKGAMADRVAAATVIIQDNPIFNLTTLRNLVAMVKPAKKKDSLTVIETLTDLFVGDLLIPEAKLRTFESHTLSQLTAISSGNKDHRKKILLMWIFEDNLKEIYAEFIKSLNNFAHDSVEANKEKAVSALSKLLMHNPEQEKVLLSSIVNKLGDPSQKVASKVIYHLCQLLYNHPNMKHVVLNEIEKMLFRSNITQKAQYYGVCFLNQFYLTNDDFKVAESLVRVYFSFFKACIKKGEIDKKIMSGLLTGVRRCKPFLNQVATEGLQQHTHALHRLVHLAPHTIAINALALLQQLGPTDRYYCALYKKLGEPESLSTTLPALLMGLVYRSVRTDENIPRKIAFIRRLLQLASMSDASRACGFLLVVGRLIRGHRIPLAFEEKSDVEAIKDEVEISEDIKTDDNTNKETEVNPDAEVNDEANKTKEEVKSKLNFKSNLWIGDKAEFLDDDDEEKYEDIPLDEDIEDHKKKLKRLKKLKKGKGWLHCEVPNEPVKEEEDEKPAEIEDSDDGKFSKKALGKDKQLEILVKKKKNEEIKISSYNAFHRNPAYCGADQSAVAELLLLQNHYHPSVRLFTEKILNDSFIFYNGDPLKDFSIARFLDRFAFKNPKKIHIHPTNEGQEASSETTVKTVKGSHPKFATRRNYVPSGIRSLSVTSAAYLNENIKQIPVDERFLYEYLQTRREQKGDVEAEDGNESDADSVGSDEFEQYLDSIGGSKVKDDDLDDEEVDYMREMVKNTKADREKKKADEAAEEEEMSDDNEISDEEEFDIDDDEDFEDSELDFSDDEGVNMNTKDKKTKKRNDKAERDLESSDDEEEKLPKSKKNKKKGIESMFASAEEFSTLLEDAGSSRTHGTSQDVANKENASVKQLRWEQQRDFWIKGSKKNKPKSFQNKKKFNKPRPSQGARKRKGNPSTTSAKKKKY